MALTFLLPLLLAPTISASSTPGSPGCGKVHTAINKTYTVGAAPNFFTSGGRPRMFNVHLPPSYDKDAPTGVIFSFHGNGKDMWFQETLSRFSDVSVNPDWIAVYPQGVDVSTVHKCDELLRRAVFPFPPPVTPVLLPSTPSLLLLSLSSSHSRLLSSPPIVLVPSHIVPPHLFFSFPPTTPVTSALRPYYTVLSLTNPSNDRTHGSPPPTPHPTFPTCNSQPTC